VAHLKKMPLIPQSYCNTVLLIRWQLKPHEFQLYERCAIFNLIVIDQGESSEPFSAYAHSLRAISLPFWALDI